MKVVSLGAGVIGVTSAWYLAKAGHEVVVLERNAGAARETSFGNGGQISVSHAEPWANPSAPLKLLKWLGRADAPLIFRLRADPAQWRYALSFLWECGRRRSTRNMVQLLKLGTYSRESLQAIREETRIEYDHSTKGTLHFHTSQAEFDPAIEPARIMRELGCARRIVYAKKLFVSSPPSQPLPRGLREPPTRAKTSQVASTSSPRGWPRSALVAVSGSDMGCGCNACTPLTCPVSSDH